jgi:hypothetical protein
VAKKLLYHMSHFQIIINNNDDEQWRSIFRKENNFYVKNLHSATCQILIDG